MMALSLMSSDQILAHQSPTVRKFWINHIDKIRPEHVTFGKHGFLWRA